MDIALHGLKRYHPDHHDITISQSSLSAIPIDGGGSVQVLNIEESEEMKDKELRMNGDSRACREEDERGIDGDIPSWSEGNDGYVNEPIHPPNFRIVCQTFMESMYKNRLAGATRRCFEEYERKEIEQQSEISYSAKERSFWLS
jgi:hypothetical protein